MENIKENFSSNHLFADYFYKKKNLYLLNKDSEFHSGLQKDDDRKLFEFSWNNNKIFVTTWILWRYIFNNFRFSLDVLACYFHKLI